MLDAKALIRLLIHRLVLVSAGHIRLVLVSAGHIRLVLVSAGHIIHLCET